MQVDRARGVATERAVAFAAAARKDGFDAAAKAAGLAVKETGAVRAGDSLADLPASQQAAQRMLALPAGGISDALPVPSGQIVIAITGTVPDEPRPFAEVRQKVEQDWRADRRRTLVAERLRGGSLETLAKGFKTEVRHQDDLQAGAGLPGVPPDPEIRRQIDSLAPGTAGDPVATSAGIVVLRVKRRDDGTAEFASQRDATRDNLMSQRRERLLRAVVRRLQDRGHVEVNESMVDAVDRSS
jgi:parvulin-like peptidyl-prolyl isomerase